ncbi:MAG TPA: DUF1398 family protein [Chryseolinea sp.]
MFTIDQIRQAHGKVKTGADFPTYIQELRKLGVTSYETFVQDGHTDYFGANDYKMSAPPRYSLLPIAASCDTGQFKADLKAHQLGRSDFPTFCRQAARWGAAKWTVSMDKMTCTYFDKEGNEILVEKIPRQASNITPAN